jgi:predicted PurR-regulated permease PerM
MPGDNWEVDWPRAFWIGFGIVLAAAAAWVFYSFVGTFVFAIFLYYATRPLYRRVYRRLRQRSLAAMVSLSLLALPVLVLLYYTIAIALQEFERFASTTDLGSLTGVLQPYLGVSDAVENPQGILNDASADALLSTLSQLVGYIGIVGTGLVHAFVMFAVAFYLLRDDHRLAAWVTDLGGDSPVVESYAIAVDRSLERVFAGNILNAVVAGIVGVLTYSLLNAVAPDPVSIPYPALLGLLAGIASLVPVVGMKLVYVPVVVYLAVQAWMAGDGWGFVVLFTGVSFVVVDVIPDLVVRPYVSGGDLHTGSRGVRGRRSGRSA